MDTPFREAVASIDLQAGLYDLELIFNEHRGNAALELSARGPGQDAFYLVGEPHGGLSLVPEPSGVHSALAGLFALVLSNRRKRGEACLPECHMSVVRIKKRLSHISARAA